MPTSVRKQLGRAWRWWCSRGGRTQFGWILLVLSLFGWPLSAITFARHEPPTVLGLSWLAVTLTATDILLTAQVHEQQEDDKPT